MPWNKPVLHSFIQSKWTHLGNHTHTHTLHILVLVTHVCFVSLQRHGYSNIHPQGRVLFKFTPTASFQGPANEITIHTLDTQLNQKMLSLLWVLNNAYAYLCGVCAMALHVRCKWFPVQQKIVWLGRGCQLAMRLNGIQADLEIVDRYQDYYLY